MEKRAYYENEIMSNIREIPESFLPEVYNLFQSIRNKYHKNDNKKLDSTGLCGIWQDDRDIKEIIAEMESGRNYFANR
ncbi:MAG: hypothetical protein V1779_03455 [bacterium]